MPAIYPVSSKRVSDLLLRTRLISQFDADRVDLLRLQDQLSTGQRLSKPSDDAPAAMRAIGIQRLIEQNERVTLNLNTSQSYVAAADNALNDVASRVIQLRGEALTVVDSTSSPSQRKVMVQELNSAVKELLDTGNHRFRGRYLFAGSTTAVQPFTRTDDGQIVYHGNQRSLSSFVDNDFLSPTNASGDQVFGAISSEVEGSVDLNPVLTMNTRLSDLHGGRGVRLGSFVISDGDTTSTIDISSAETVADVVRLIESNPPQDRTLVVRLNGHGLVVDLDDGGGGNLTIRDVPSGTTALELGIREELGVGSSPLVGNDINPQLRPTTALRNLLGTRATAFLESGGGYNDIFIESVDNGDSWNNVTVRFTAGTAAGDQAFATYDEANKTLEIDISPGTTTAGTVVAAINATPQFQAQLDKKLEPSNDGAGVVDFNATAVTAGGSGDNLDLQSGVQVVQGGQTFLIDLADAETLQDLLNAFNGSQAHLLARINPAGSGIDIQSRASGSDFSIGENGGRLATQLGLRTLHRESRLAELNHDRGVDRAAGPDFLIHRKDGQTLEIDISAAETVGDVIDLINSHPDNTGNPVLARLAAFGNGIELYDENEAGSDILTVERRLSFAAWDLGFVPQGEDSAAAQPPRPASAALAFPPPSHLNTALVVTANQNGFALNDVAIEFLDTRLGDVADATYDAAGKTLTVNLDASQTTANSVLAAISAEGTFTASLDLSKDTTNDGTGVVAATGLVGATQGGSAESLQGRDVHPRETHGLFNSLLKLSQAVEDFDLEEIRRTVAMLDEDFGRLNFARAELGGRGRAFDALQRRVEDEQVELRATLSLEIDTDMVKAISELTARQASLQASLQLVGRLLQTTVLDFL